MSRLAPEHYAEALLRIAGTHGREAALAAADRVADELIASGRGAWLPRVLVAVEARDRRASGVAEAAVETASALAAAEKKELAAALGVGMDAMLLEERVDPALGAGVRVTADGMLVEETVQHRLQKLFPK